MKDINLINLNFSDEALIELETLKVQTNSNSNAATIRKALMLLKWYVGKKEQGTKVYLGIDDENMQEIDLVFDDYKKPNLRLVK
jgi:hypothetical protein